MREFNTYFSAKHILSKGAIINYVGSDRSDGKTFDCKVRALENYKENKNVLIYVRRYATEMETSMYETFMDEVILQPKYKELVGNYEFLCSKHGVKIREKNTKEWDDFILFIPATKFGRKKSGIPIHRVKEIDYDEFVPLDNIYLKDEIRKILDFYKTVDRQRYTTQVLILGNKIDAFSPVFDYFNIPIEIDEKQFIRTYKNGTVAVQLYGNKEHREVEEKSVFNDLVKGTSYENFNNGGVLNGLIIKYEDINQAEYMCSFKSINGEGSIYTKDGKLIISTKTRKDGYILSDEVYSMERECYCVLVGGFCNMIKTYYRSGKMCFTDKKAWHYFEPIIRKCGR